MASNPALILQINDSIFFSLENSFVNEECHCEQSETLFIYQVTCMNSPT
jgi:hypothetical protein